MNNTNPQSSPLDKPQRENLSSHKSSNMLAITIGILILIFIVCGITYSIKSTKKSIETTHSTTQATVTSEAIPDPKQILMALEQALKVNAPITEKKADGWFDQRKQRTPLTGQGFVLGTFSNAYMGKYGNFTINDAKATTQTFTTLQSSLDSFFTTQGFQKDNQNTLILQSAPPFITLGYTKNTIHCLITLTPQTDLFGDFFCGMVDQLQISWKKELTPAINITNDPAVDVTVEKIVGNYATGGV